MTDEELFKLAVRSWGVEFQVDMVIEELGELIVAIQKWRRKPGVSTIRSVATEVADVELMLGQLNYIMDNYVGPEYKVSLDSEREFKRTRLHMRLEEVKKDVVIKEER